VHGNHGLGGQVRVRRRGHAPRDRELDEFACRAGLARAGFLLGEGAAVAVFLGSILGEFLVVPGYT
jgi:hypothetical protein